MEELNEFFANNNILTHMDPSNQENIYLGEECYNYSKFYWEHIELQHVIKALMSCKSEAIDHDDLPHKLLKLALPSFTCGYPHI